MKYTRRRFLGNTVSAGAAAALLSMTERSALANGEAPKRVIFWWVPEGATHQALWPAHGPGPLTINPAASVGGGQTPQSRGDSINNYRSEAMGTYCLQPLADHVDDITLLSGFQNGGAGGSSDPHYQVIDSALTGGSPGEGSIDQVIGPMLQGTAPFHAIFSSLYGEHVHYNVGTGYACPYRTTSGGHANATWNPVTTFNQLFPGGLDGDLDAGPDHRLLSRFRVLGSVRNRIDAVRCRGGAAAQRRMEAYLQSIEQVEEQTEGLIGSGGLTGDISVDIPPDWIDISDDNKYWHDPKNFAALAKIQIDTTVAALATDRTRCSLMQFSATGTTQGLPGNHYEHIGIGDLENGNVADHKLGHDGGDTARRNQARIFRWYYAQLAYLIDRLKAVPDVDGRTLFDNTLIVCASEWGSYNHRKNDVPYVLVGNPTGAFQTGWYFDAHDGGFRNHADLFLAIMLGVGLEVDRFGTSTNPYTDLFA